MDPNIVHMNLRNFPNHGNSYTRLPPLCSQSNGFVERAIQTITKTLRKQKEDDSDSYLAILVLHPTKNSCYIHLRVADEIKVTNKSGNFH